MAWFDFIKFAQYNIQHIKNFQSIIYINENSIAVILPAKQTDYDTGDRREW